MTMTGHRNHALSIALGGMIALAVSQGVGRFVYTPILPRMIEALGLSRGEAGMIASANFLGYLVGALLAAAPFMGGRARLYLLGALVTSSLSGAAMGAFSSLGAFALLRFLGGVASAFVMVFSSTLILDRLQAIGRPQLSATHFAGVGVGIAASAVAVAILIGWGAGWPVLWVATGALSLAATALVVKLVPASPPIPPAPSAPVAKVPREGLPWFAVAYGLFGFGYVITATFLVAIVRDAPDLRSVEPAVWVFVGLAGVPSVQLWTWLAGRIGLPRAFALACLIEAVGVIVSVTAQGAAAIILAACLLGGTFMGISALGLVGGRRLSPDNPRRTLALMTSAFGLGQIVGPTFAGLLFDATGSFLAPSIAAASALVVAAGCTVFVRLGNEARVA